MSPFPNEHACRIHPLGGYQKESFRRIKRGKYSMVIAKRPGKDTTEVQSFRYPIADWTEDGAKTHCKDQGGTFEAASKEEKIAEISAEELLELAEQNPELADYQLVEKALGEGQGVGGPKQGVGGTDTCVCPECGEEVEHERGTPCTEVECPECGAMMSPALEKRKETRFILQLKGATIDLVKLAEMLSREFGPPFLDPDIIKAKMELDGTYWLRIGPRDIHISSEGTVLGTGIWLTEELILLQATVTKCLETKEEKTMEKETAPTPSKFYSLKTRDGRDCWVALSGSSYEDREGEIIARKAIDFGIAHGDETGQRGELRLYHYPGSKVGECTFQYRRGNFLVEAGLWDDTVRARKAKEWVAGRNPDEVGVSVGFFYNPKKFKRDKALDAMVYEDEVIFFERSILKREHASCPWATVSTIQGGLKAMSNKEDLVEMVGEGETKAILEGVDEKAKDLEEQKVAFKEDQEKVSGEGLLEQVKKLSEDDLKAFHAQVGKLLKVEEKEVKEEVVEEKQEVEEKQVGAPEEVQFRLDDAAIKAIAEAVKEMLPDNSKLEAEITALKEATGSATEKLTEQVETKVKEVFEDLPKVSIYRATKVTEEEPKEEPRTAWVSPLERNLEDGIREIEKAREAGR